MSQTLALMPRALNGRHVMNISRLGLSSFFSAIPNIPILTAWLKLPLKITLSFAQWGCFMSKRDGFREEAIIVDHLAFSVPVAEFRHLERAGGDFKKCWKSFPKRNWKNIKDVALKESLMSDWQAECHQVCMERFKQFCRRVLGVRISASRDKGLHGYTNSAKILSLTTTVELGFVGFGGNNDTIYVQLSGEGCKHVFSKTRPFNLHFWLGSVLSVKKLNRVDLAYDDFDGNYSIDYAEKAYFDDAFKSRNGGRNPKATYIKEVQGHTITGYTFAVGSRQSNVYWRIYDKAQEQGAPSGTVWYRTEAELKKCSIDVLLSPAKAFAGINRFSESINLEHGLSLASVSKKTVLDFNARIRWAKRQCGRTLADILETFGGDIYHALGLLVDERGGKFNLPDTQALLLNKALNEVSP